MCMACEYDSRTSRHDGVFFVFNDTATTEIYTLSLHDALPISFFWMATSGEGAATAAFPRSTSARCSMVAPSNSVESGSRCRSEEHTSELQSRQYLVCRLLLEKKNKI